MFNFEFWTKGLRRAALVGGVFGAGLVLSACEEGKGFSFKSKEDAAASTETRLVERDTEAPEVFQVAEDGLWDGRPSLGGVWVAHSAVESPERVIIRNAANGKFVIGALFKRERDNPGPSLQVSSDAASALGMLAGAPATLSVTALRREEVAPEPEAPILDTAETLPSEDAPAAATIAAAPIADSTPVENIAAAALDKVDAAPAAANLSKPFVQIGIFSVEANANRAAKMLEKAGLSATVKAHQGAKPYWRVLAGPAGSEQDRGAMLSTIKGLGFPDAYFVKN